MRRCLLVLGLLASAAAAAPHLEAVPFTDVTLTDSFWAPRIKVNRETVLPSCFKFCTTTGRIDNFSKAAGTLPGKFRGIFFDDSDVYKVIEGAAYCLTQQRDPALEAQCDAVIDKIAAAQQPDGYLYTFYTVNKTLNLRWSNERTMHETYCAGHMIEAAVAYFRATGKRKFLDVVCRVADHIDSVFGPDKKHEAPGHAEIELALIKLYRVTGQERYFKLAQFFLEEHGHALGGRKLQGDYSQDHKPIREHTDIVGHAVRAMYFYSGIADLAALTDDQTLADAMDRIWHDVVDRKMYLTGGIGPSGSNEGFTVAYDLPNDSAYAETCASIGMALWNHRLALRSGDAKYADVLERVAYNGLISGVSLSGDHFFYVNPLGSRGGHHRQEWFGCACCPTNIVRWLPSVGGYVYAHTDDTIYTNLYLASSAKVALKAGAVGLTQATDYPWDGRIRLTVEPGAAREFALKLRIPGWAQEQPVPGDLYRFADDLKGEPAVTLTVNGLATPLALDRGYATLRRTWAAGDRVELSLPMPVRRVAAHAAVKADVGRVALQRGPIVYCVEAVDTPNVRKLALTPDLKLSPVARPELLGGVTVLQGDGLLAVPYYAWDNRAAGGMQVWFPTSAPAAPATLAGRATATASYCWRADSTEALNDGVEPKSSADESVPRLTWWDHKATTEWLQYAWPQAQRVSKVAVYWFDDTGRGGCRVPASWRVLVKVGDAWQPVTGAGAYGTARDRFNEVSFDPVSTTAVRVEAVLAPGMSGGVLEWKVE